ncbi:hypothetical protein [Aneurinibacillus tyrosinisolvens]|uniref:hypothetical protein n=1 Tax=Aneurinibacillus tyrosinisolvens TaxID=1443435 RepID=UPI00063F5BE4|nr:hypothetical protein [Aneurinibacillus tyrosinisolvens]
MDYTKIIGLIFIGVAAFSVIYYNNFQKSAEGKDERGMLIQYQTYKFMFQIVYCGVGILLVLRMVRIFSIEQLENSLYILLILTYILGAFYIYRKGK